MRYDAAGNLTNDSWSSYGNSAAGVITRGYDAENRMTSALDSSGGVSYYTYNADGQRVRRKSSSGETWQVYGIGGELLADYAATSGSLQKEYGYRNGQLLITADATALPAVPVFSDNFNDNSLDSTKWSVFDPNSPATVTEQTQQLRFTLLPNTAAYNGVYSNSTHDIRGKTVQVEVQPISQAGWCENYLQVMLDSQNYFLINVGAGTMIFRSRTNGVNDQLAISYDPAALPFWRLRHDQAANTMSFETSSSGINWTTRKTVNVGFSLTAVRFYLMAGAWGTGNGSPGAAKYDNFQLAQSGASPAVVTNLALNKPATQISTYTNAVAGRAVDGNTNGAYSGGSVTHTNNATQAWWQVDLGNSYALETIKVWNRTDCCGDRLANFYVFVSDQPFSSSDLNATLNQVGVNNYYTSGQGGSPTYVGVNRNGRYVRVQLSTAGGPLSLAEVEVMGSTIAVANLNWLVTDQLGTPRMVFDKTGSLAGTKRHDYLPFGEELTTANGLRTAALGYGSPDGVRQKFTSKERNTETGLDYFGARYYGSTQGRFTSADPLMASAKLWNPQTWSRYSYVSNRPVNLVDPNGMDECTPQHTCQMVTDEEAARSKPSQALIRETVNVNTSDQDLLETSPIVLGTTIEMRSIEPAAASAPRDWDPSCAACASFLPAMANAVAPIPSAVATFGVASVVGGLAGGAALTAAGASTVTTLTIDSFAVTASGAATDTAVIGSLGNTAQYAGRAGYNILQASKGAYTFEAVNVPWLHSIIQQGQRVLVTTGGVMTSREIDYLQKVGGYVMTGDMLVPPH